MFNPSAKKSTKKVLVLGGSGFLGKSVVSQLSARGYAVRVPTRRLKRANELILLPRVEVIEADVVSKPETLSGLLVGCETVINLVGILHGGPKAMGEPYSQNFSKAHVELPERLVKLSADKKINRLIHVSAIGANKTAPSQYLRSKGFGEAHIHLAPSLWTIFRPSIVTHPEAPFCRQMMALARYLPILALPSADAMLQPVFVGDVARAIVESIENPSAYYQTYELGGPTKMSFAEVLHHFARYQGKSRVVLGMPSFLATMIAFLAEFSPLPVLSRDNLASLSVPSTTDSSFPFGINPQSMDAIFAKTIELQRLDDWRTYAKR